MSCRIIAHTGAQTAGELSERPSSNTIHNNGRNVLAGLAVMYSVGLPELVAQFRRRVASYDVMVPAKNLGPLGAIAIN